MFLLAAGQHVLITGASAGIGAALAIAYAAAGARLLLLARRQDRLSELIRTLGDDRAQAVVADVTDDTSLRQAVRIGRERFGPIDTVIANAGFAVTGKLQDLTTADYQRQFDTNVLGVLRTIYVTLDDLKQTRGRLGVIGSVNGYLSIPGASAYAMSKAAVRALCDSLYHEFRPLGVSVTHIAPGMVKSEIRQVNNQGVYDPAAPAVPSPLEEMNPEDAAEQIRRAIDARRREAVIGAPGKLMVWMSRHAPGVVAMALRRRADRRG